MESLIIQTDVLPERRLELIQSLQGLEESTRHLDIDVQQYVFEDMVNRNRLLLALRFQGQAGLDAFRASEAYHSLLGSIKVLGTLESLEHGESLTDWLVMHPASAGEPTR